MEIEIEKTETAHLLFNVNMLNGDFKSLTGQP